ncbi:transposase [Asticcacaulis sp.]|uniref:IS66-like element accessory protein TnpA n=1 Tax=Asticcacaulis sp. TaxID=1872648 RepID=UPI002614836B|nr:transposase [Asticcacaulis sp.]
MSYQRAEFLTGTERRRFYSRDDKARLVDEAFRPGGMVAAAARRLGVHESLLYRWRRELSVPVEAEVGDTGFLPVTVALDDGPAPSVPPPSICTEPAVAEDPPVPAVPAILEVTLPGGTCVRMQGTVDPALAVSVLKVLAVPGRCS